MQIDTLLLFGSSIYQMSTPVITLFRLLAEPIISSALGPLELISFS